MSCSQETRDETSLIIQEVPVELDSGVVEASGVVEEPPLQEYRVDGQTPIDDVLFASVFAQMDNAVWEKCNEVQLPSERRQFEDFCVRMSDEDDSDLSSSDEEEEKYVRPKDDMAELESGEEDNQQDAVDFGAVFGLPADLQAIADTLPITTGGEIKFLGTVLNSVGDIITVTVDGAAFDNFDLATVCCLSDRRVVGVIVDTFGPTTAPFYVIKHIHNTVQVSPGDQLYVDLATSKIAAVDTNPDAENDQIVSDDEPPKKSRAVRHTKAPPPPPPASTYMHQQQVQQQQVQQQPIMMVHHNQAFVSSQQMPSTEMLGGGQYYVVPQGHMLLQQPGMIPQQQVMLQPQQVVMQQQPQLMMAPPNMMMPQQQYMQQQQFMIPQQQQSVMMPTYAAVSSDQQVMYLQPPPPPPPNFQGSSTEQ